MFALIVVFSVAIPGYVTQGNLPVMRDSVSVVYLNTHALCRDLKRDTIRQNKGILKSAECFKKSP